MVHPNANRVDIGIPVLIVGAGPAGLTLAPALARHGVPALTVEKHPSTAHAAYSHHQSAHRGDSPGSRHNAGNHDSPIRQSRIECEPAFSHRHQAGLRPGATRSHTHGKTVV